MADGVTQEDGGADCEVAIGEERLGYINLGVEGTDT